MKHQLLLHIVVIVVAATLLFTEESCFRTSPEAAAAAAGAASGGRGRLRKRVLDEIGGRGEGGRAGDDVGEGGNDDGEFLLGGEQWVGEEEEDVFCWTDF